MEWLQMGQLFKRDQMLQKLNYCFYNANYFMVMSYFLYTLSRFLFLDKNKKMWSECQCDNIISKCLNVCFKKKSPDKYYRIAILNFKIYLLTSLWITYLFVYLSAVLADSSLLVVLVRHISLCAMQNLILYYSRSI